jgi:hypothetical protein
MAQNVELLDKTGSVYTWAATDEGRTIIKTVQDAAPIIRHCKLAKTHLPDNGRQQFFGKNGKLIASIPAGMVEAFAVQTRGEFMKMNTRDKVKFIKRKLADGSLQHFDFRRT